MNPSQLFHFNTSLTQPLLEKGAVIDETNGVIYEVSLITGGLEARGHGLEVDDTTLKQMLACAQAKEQVSVKTNHGSGAEAVNGYLANFRLKGKKVVGDWFLLKHHPQNAHIVEMAKRMPKNIGLSAAFMGLPENDKKQKVFRGEDADPKWAGKFYTITASGARSEFQGKKYARCEELVTVDLVAQPAANPEGLFNVGVDTRRGGMAKNNLKAGGEQEGEEPSLAQVVAMLSSINERLDGIEEFQNEFLNDQEGEEEEEEDFTNEEDGEEGAEGEEEGELATAGAGAEGGGQFAAGTLGGVMNQFQAKLNELEQRETNRARRAELAQQAQAFEVLHGKIDQVTTFAQELLIQNEAQAELIEELQAQIKTGHVGVQADKANLFNAPQHLGEMTAFEARVVELSAAGKTPGQATALAQKEDAARYQQHLKTKGVIA